MFILANYDIIDLLTLQRIIYSMESAALYGIFFDSVFRAL